MRRLPGLSGLLAAGVTAALLTGVVRAADAAPAAEGRQAAAPAGAQFGTDSPAGFWYGTDSFYMPVKGPAPYTEPVIGGSYGGYIGMAGNWARHLGCGDKVAWSATNSKEANNNRTWHGKGIGTGVYFFMGGPGVDPHYNGTTPEASAWGQRQAAWALNNAASLKVRYPVMFADVELPGAAPGISPAPDNGWNSVHPNPCSGKSTLNYIDPNVDRAVLNGFFSYLASHSSYRPGVYSSPQIWPQIFGTGSAATLRGVGEWTYTNDTSSLAHIPSGWCLRTTSICARFFGGINSSSPDALMWQWSGGGGTYNGYGDFDQIDANRTP
jgi:hypothetical protein